ncbi:MAG TPA: hypothetical protein VLG92_02935 [Candidatus Saccharimonadia bacterium]|nr:hypothetical protein [Candidatus Saccharimonadia bacterium]
MSIETDTQGEFGGYLSTTLDDPGRWMRSRMGILVLSRSTAPSGNQVAVRFGFPDVESSIKGFRDRRGWLVASEIAGKRRLDIVPDQSYLADYRGGIHRLPDDTTALRNIGRGILLLTTNPDEDGVVVEMTVPCNHRINALDVATLNGESLIPYESLQFAEDPVAD